MRAQHPGAPPELRIRAYETDKRRIGALEALGYVRGGPDGVVFRMSLDGALPEPPNPDGLTLRDSEGVDPALRAAAHRAAWSHLEHLGIHGESQFTTEAYLALRGLPVYRPSLDILAVSPGGEFVGGCIAWADPVSGVGVFEPVGTALAWRGRRVAALVMAEALRRLKALGMREARVGTAQFNHAAIAAYRAAGFETADRTFWWEKAL